ncbi:histone-lysine N-methyltransferase, H3 lysine-9 specific SUVH1 [Magnolia sinica]|uniref:histone-lysine N-methyltransferase, H3 lysine-9 specific SUVH1 n=1 Tax=Magnolia sinica TaxID=86752 RepID=UPI00265863A8|nr:histone-lysine N-methyltransferase, H3 lysine-9 specific SUVH1 [Magnolia sinica]
MADGLNCNPPTDESPILDVKPLRILAPMFPAPFGYTTFSPPDAPPSYVCVTPFGPFPPGCTPFIPPPSSIPPSSQRPYDQTPLATDRGGNVGEASGFENPNNIPSPSFHTPQPTAGPANGFAGQPKPIEIYEADGTLRQQTVSGNFSGPASTKDVSSKKRKQMVNSRKRSVYQSSSTMSSSDTEASNEKSQKIKAQKRVRNNGDTIISLPVDGDRDSVERLLITYDALRRRLLQLDDVRGPTPGASKRPDLKAGAIMMSNGLRVNMSRRVGAAPGVEVGDLFFFRFEMCLVGLHAPSMGGIDYTNVKFDQEEEPVALSIVSSGMYEDDDDDTDVLIYSGQGGSSKVGKQIDDQKLQRGNLALERSSHRKNEIRVIRGMKDEMNSAGKIYMYDGLYKIQESWIEKGKSGFSVFKYKLLRMPGQPDGSALWKITQKWKESPSSRGNVILPDISSGAENLPVCLVNDVDEEKGPTHFSYITTVKYLKPISSMKLIMGCPCHSVCMPGDANCSCSLKNGGVPPYSSNGLLTRRKALMYECGSSCMCSINCRNRVSQKGIRFRFEIFKTRDRGWGLRSWDPIRAGSFICEYTGEVIPEIRVEDEDEDDDYIFEASCSNENYFEWNYIHELLGEEKPEDLSENPKPLPIIISAKNTGNVSRFMNHSCSPNIFWQPVLYDHDDDWYPHIMFYAIKHIPPMTELTYDYGLSKNQSDNVEMGGHRKRQKCLCGSSRCRGFFG